MSARSYALYCVCTHLSFSFFRGICFHSKDIFRSDRKWDSGRTGKPRMKFWKFGMDQQNDSRIKSTNLELKQRFHLLSGEIVLGIQLVHDSIWKQKVNIWLNMEYQRNVN